MFNLSSNESAVRPSTSHYNNSCDTTTSNTQTVSFASTSCEVALPTIGNKVPSEYNMYYSSSKPSPASTPTDDEKKIISTKSSIESYSNSTTSHHPSKPSSFLQSPKLALGTNKVHILQNPNTPLLFGQKLIHIYTLTKENIQIVVDPKCFVWDIYNCCCQYLNIDDDSLLGLSYRCPSEGMTNDDKPRHEYFFLNPDQKICKYLPKSPKFSIPSKRGKQRPVLLLYLRIRVYIDRIDLLTCDVSLQHYYLQLKENFLEHWNTNSIASEERCWQMAFLALQADKIVLDDTLFKVEKYFPLWIVNLRGIDYIKKNINQLITEHKKYNSKDAMIAFCQESSRSPFALNCHLYGIRRHKADVLDNTLIGILDKGIELWDVKENSERIPLKVLNWNKMTKLSFDKKKVKISVSDGYDVEVFAQNDTKARYLLTFCKEFHQQIIHINLQLANLGRHTYIAKTNPFFNGEICPSTSRASSSITQRSSMAESSQSTSGVVSDNHEGSPDVSQKIHYTKTNSNNGSMESMNSSLSENYRDNNCYGEREACNNLTTIKDSGSLEATPNSSGDLSALKQIKVSLKSAEVEELSDKLRHTSVGENNDYLLRNKCKSNDSGTPISRRLKKNDLVTNMKGELTPLAKDSLDQTPSTTYAQRAHFIPKREDFISIPDQNKLVIMNYNINHGIIDKTPKANQVSPKLVHSHSAKSDYRIHQNVSTPEHLNHNIHPSNMMSQNVVVPKQRRYASKSPSRNGINRVNVAHLQHQKSADPIERINFYEFFDKSSNNNIQHQFVNPSNMNNIQHQFVNPSNNNTQQPFGNPPNNNIHQQFCNAVSMNANIQHQFGNPINMNTNNIQQQFGNPSNMNTNIQQQCDNMPSNLSVPPEYNNRLNYNKPKSIIKTCTEAPIIAEMGIKPTQLKEYPMMRALLQENYELPISSNGSSPSATLTSFSSSSQDNSGNGYSSSKQGTISNNRIKILPTLATQKSEYHSENTDLVCNHCHQPSPNTPHKHNSFQHNQSLLQPSMKNETEVFRYFNPSDFGINDPACEIPTSSANQYNFNRQSNAQSGIAYREPNINQQMPVQSYLPNNVKLNTNKFSHHHLFANHSDDYVLDLGPPPPYPTVNAAH